MIFSLLDYPVGVIPNITRVLPEDRVIDTVAYVHGREYPEEFDDSEDDEFGIPPLPNAQPIHTPLQQAGRKISFNFLRILAFGLRKKITAVCFLSRIRPKPSLTRW